MKKNLKISVQRIGRHRLPLPAYATVDSSGMDLMAALEKPLIIKPWRFLLIPTGFAIGLPTGYEAQIRPRSGLAAKFGITVLNTPGTIDADYRGEVKIILINLGPKSFKVNPGDRVAQMIIQPVVRASLFEVKELVKSRRGAGGFGHTGI